MNILLFEDSHVPDLYPLTLGRPAFAVSCAGFRLIDLVGTLPGRHSASVRPHLSEILRHDYELNTATVLDGNDPWTLLVNARCAATQTTLHHLQTLAACSSPRQILCGSSLAIALLPTEWLQRGSIDEPHLIGAESFPDAEQIQNSSPLMELLAFPHDLIRINSQAFNANLEYRIRHGDYVEISEGVFALPGQILDAHVVCRTQDGPIVLDDQVQVGPFSVLEGPLFVGRNSRIAPHSVIKDSVSIGHTCKIGGELEATVVEGFTNKQHHGFLGHSYLGSWINLGAGTCNSDLKNTYGTVNMVYGTQRVATGMQFVGCFIGDYAKSAINTSIFTGKVIGCGSMLYGFVTTNVPSFCNYARTFGGLTQINDEVMITTQKRMFGRRNVEQRPCDIQLLRDMIRLTQNERGPLDEQPLEL